MAKVRKAMVQAYAEVNGISTAQAEEEAHIQRMQAAPMQVASYPECFLCESEEDRDTRLELRGPENGEFSDLAQHFKALRPELKNMAGAYGAVFTMQNELDGGHITPGETESKAEDETDVSERETAEVPEGMNGASASVQDTLSDYNKKNVKEETNMAAAETSTNLIEQEEQRIRESTERAYNEFRGGENPSVGSMPNDGTIDKEVANKILNDSRDAILTLMENTRVINVVFGRPVLSRILVQGESATGTIADPKKALASFEEALGWNAQDNEYKKAAPDGDLNEVKAMHDALREAVSDENKEFKINIGKGGPSIKGWNVQLPGEDKARVMTVQALKEFMISHGCFLMYIDKASDVQLRMKAVGKKTTNATGKADKDVAQDTSNPLKGIFTVAVANRRDANKEDRLLGIALYHKEIDQTRAAEKKSGPKSEMSCKFMRTPKGSNVAKKATYRIPLVAEQYQVAVVDAELKSVFGNGESAVGGTQPVDLSSSEAVRKLFAEMSDVMTAAASRNAAFGDDSLIGKVKKASAEAAAKRAESDAADVADNL